MKPPQCTEAAIRGLKQELATLTSSSKELEERRDLLNYQIEELLELNFTEGELESLESEQAVKQRKLDHGHGSRRIRAMRPAW